VFLRYRIWSIHQAAYGFEIVNVTDVEKLPGVKNCGLIVNVVLTIRPLVLAVGTIAFMMRGPLKMVVLLV
jgi:hypothetical protein